MKGGSKGEVDIFEMVRGYKDYVERLDLNDDPAVFGMHPNANITYQSQETEKLLSVIASINRNKGKAGGESSNEIVLRYCDQILNSDELNLSLINLNDLRGEHKIENERGLIPPLSTVLLQEVERFNNLLTVITESIERLIEAINGTKIMSATLDNVYNSLLNNQVPSLWTQNAYPSLKPFYSWIRDLVTRVNFFKMWVKDKSPVKFFLPYFFFPQGFLTGVLQTYARTNQVAIDRLKFEFRVTDPEKESLEDPPEGGGVFIDGLYLDGAIWDKKRKSLEKQPDGVMFDLMLPIAFVPVEMKDENVREKKAARKVNYYS